MSQKSVRKYNRKKAVRPKKVYSPRGGFQSYLPSYLKNPTAKKVGKVLINAAGNYMDKATDTETLGFSKKVVGYATKVASRGKELEMIPNTYSGAAATGPERIPSLTKKRLKITSGYNDVYRAKVHKLHVIAGEPPSRALEALVRQNGEQKREIFSTLRNTQTGDERKHLTRAFGFNQKVVAFIDPDFFGCDVNRVWNDVLELSPHTTSSTLIQRVYGAVTKISNVLTISNNNLVLPTFISVKLIRQKQQGIRGKDIPNNVFNTLAATQEDGHMTALYQVGSKSTSLVGTFAEVDPTRNDVHSCPNATACYEIVKSKTIKLGAGDHLEFTYDHLYKSGIDLRLLMAAREGVTMEDNSLYTYGLVVEGWGPKVEAVGLDAAALPLLPTVRYSGSGPGQFSMEMKVTAYGAKASAQGVVSTTGFIAGPFAERVFTDASYDISATEIANFDYQQLGAANGIDVPLLSDKFVTYGGNRK